MVVLFRLLAARVDGCAMMRPGRQGQTRISPCFDGGGIRIRESHFRSVIGRG